MRAQVICTYEQKSTYWITCISELPFYDDDVVVSIIGTWTLTFEGILAELDFKENGTVKESLHCKRCKR